MTVRMEKPAFCYRFGTAEFDEARCELRVAGLAVDVERRALDVLAYLLRHAGEVVTKEELLREVWAGRVTVDKVVPNAINKLRRALGQANAGHIATQARAGYRLDGLVSRIAVGRQPVSQMKLAPGQPLQSRPHFVLQRQLGHAGGSEVWLAEHQKTHEARVFKFALDAGRLRALKREVTLLRVMHDGVSNPRHVVELLDWNFESAPYFIECRYAGPTLSEWAAQHLPALDTPARLALFLQIADAVAAAHAVGVLHKDLKPANVLVEGGAAQPWVRLTDFGSGHLLDPDRLSQMGITRLGLTVEQHGNDPSSGTPLYTAPELFDGMAPTVRSDVYALGVMLYQLLLSRFGQPMASGWEADVADELLREDLRLATDVNPERRLGSAADLASRLRRLDQRRSEIELARQYQQAVRRDRQTLARARARRPYVLALVAALAVGVVMALILQHEAVVARNEAQLELHKAGALARFLNEDLIGRSNPLVSAKGSDATLREVLLSARDRVGERFRAQPQAAAEIHASLAAMFGAVDLFDEAQTQARLALELNERLGGAASPAALQARAVLVNALARQSRLDEAQQTLEALERLVDVGDKPNAAGRAEARHQVAVARSAVLLRRGDFVHASAELRNAIDTLDEFNPDHAARRDALRLERISALGLAAERRLALQEGRQLLHEVQARPGDNELTIALIRLAMVRGHGEDHAAIEQLLLQAQPVIVARLGEDHSRHLRLLGELQGVAFRRGDWPRANTYAQALHERARAKFGPDHATTYVTLLNWARTLGEAGQGASAVDKAREGHEQMVRLLGPGAPQVQDAAFVRAWMELEAQRPTQALKLIDTIKPSVLETYRASGVWQAGVDALRGIALQQRGQAAAARPLLDDALVKLKGEEDLAQPSRVYVLAQRARARLP